MTSGRGWRGGESQNYCFCTEVVVVWPKRFRFFFPRKSYLLHSLTRFGVTGIFFLDPEKKIQTKNSEILKIWQNFQKIRLLVTIDFEFGKITNHTMLSDFLSKMVIKDTPIVFFFPSKLGAGKINTANFTHSFLF